jgi:hypothetical protein
MTLFLIRSAMCAMMPATERLPGVADAEPEAFLRRLRREADPLYWLGLKLGALLFTITPLITVGIPLPSFLLPRRWLERHTERIVIHPLYLLRQMMYLLRLTAGMCWGSDSRVRTCFDLEPLAPDPGSFRKR